MTRGSTKTYTISTERIEIRDPRTGELRAYDALEDVPEELRKEIAETLLGSAGGGRRTRITVTDPSGATRTYDSVEEMPADVRKIYERVRGEGRQ